MQNIKYIDETNVRYIEYLNKMSLDLNLVHAGIEQCMPSHICSGERDEYILHFILSGKGFFSPKSDNVYPLSKGQMFLISPNKPVIYGADANNPWQYAWIGFDGLRADAILKKCGFSVSTRILPLPEKLSLMSDYFDHILEHDIDTFGSGMRKEAWMLMLFSRLMDSYEKQGQNTPPSQFHQYNTKSYIELAIEYIKTSYHNGINVSDIATRLGVSRAYLNYVFQNELNTSIQQYLIGFRMNKAANLLVNTTLTIKEISSAIGYTDQLTFSKAFKKKFGVSPKTYRIEHKVAHI